MFLSGAAVDDRADGLDYVDNESGTECEIDINKEMCELF